MAESCGICSRTREQHDLDDCHHIFSPEGKLIQKPSKKPEPKQRPGFQIDPREGVAARLAVMLVRKELLTEAELTSVLTGLPMGEVDASHTPANPH